MKDLLKIKSLWWVVPLGVIAFYFIFDPEKSGFMPQCVFHKITGLQCMGCGAQRMAHSLLHGDFKAAMEANAFLFFSLPVLGFLVFVELNRKRFPSIYRKIHSVWVIITLSAMLLTWLIVRNILEI